MGIVLIELYEKKCECKPDPCKDLITFMLKLTVFSAPLFHMLFFTLLTHKFLKNNQVGKVKMDV